MERLQKALSVLVLLLVGSAIPAQIGAMVSGSNSYEDNCGNTGSVTVTAGPRVNGVQVYYVGCEFGFGQEVGVGRGVVRTSVND